MVSNNTNAATKSGVWLAGDYIPTVRSKYTVTALLGPQQYQVVLPAVPVALQNVTGQTYNLFNGTTTRPHGPARPELGH